MTDVSSISNQVRVRFAPSPTGFLHIGGARTALFNWLFARANGGKFLLRIEDTDRERSEARYTEDIMESLRWLGFDWDEEPVFQSARFEKYAAIAQELVKKGLAYPCDCTPEQLDAVRKECEKHKQPFRYPGTCKSKKSVAEKHVLRMVTPSEGETGFNDLIRGPIAFPNKDVDDWVILRSDKSPTYNFCVVIDDHDMKMTHVLRGDDHINNTPKQILLYQALGYPVPQFAHLPMIMGTDRSKLSKRHGAASTLEYRKMGYLPDAMINFLVRLGWSHGDQEIFMVEELKKMFNVAQIGKSSAIFNPEKLNWTSGHFMRSTSPKSLREYVQKYFGEELAYCKDVPQEQLEGGIAIVQGKVKNILEMIDQMKCLFGEDPSYQTEAMKPEDRERMLKLLNSVHPVVKDSDFSKADLEARVRQQAESMGEKLTPLAQALRFAVTGGKISPGLFDMLEIQGKATVIRRMEKAIGALSAA